MQQKVSFQPILQHRLHDKPVSYGNIQGMIEVPNSKTTDSQKEGKNLPDTSRSPIRYI